MSIKTLTKAFLFSAVWLILFYIIRIGEDRDTWK